MYQTRFLRCLFYFFLAVCYFSVRGQSVVWDEIKRYEQKVNDTLLGAEQRGDAIAELDRLYWAAAPRSSEKYIFLMEELVRKSKSKKLEVKFGLLKIRMKFNQGRFQECLEDCIIYLQKAKDINDLTSEVNIISKLVTLNNSDRSGNLAGLESSAQDYLLRAKSIRLGAEDGEELSALAQVEAGFLLTQKEIGKSIYVLLENEQNIGKFLKGSTKLIHYAYTFNLLGRCYLMQNEIDKSRYYLTKAEKICVENNLGGIKYVVYLHQALLAEKSKATEQAKIYYQKCQGELNVMTANKKPAILGILSTYYAKQKNWQVALLLKNQQSELIDSLFDVEKLHNFVYYQEKLKSKDKELQISKLTAHNQIVETEKRNIKNTLLFVVAVLILFILLGSLYYFTKKDLIELTEKKQILMSLLAHDIRSPVIGMKVGLPLMLDSLNITPLPSIQSRLEYLYHSLSDVNSNIENLFYFVNIKSKNRKFLKSEFHVWNELQTIIDEIKYKATEKNIDLIFLEKSNITINTDRLVFVSIFRNILNNAIQYSYENSNIEIGVILINNMAEIKIRDFGPGIDQNTMNKVKNGEKLGDETNKFANKGSQIGLHVSFALAKANGIELKYVNKQPGMEFSMIIHK